MNAFQRGPNVVFWQQGQAPNTVAAQLSRAGSRHAVRITGGCSDLGQDTFRALMRSFVDAFENFHGAILIGGTRIHDRDGTVVPAITELGPAISFANRYAIVLGVIPRVGPQLQVDRIVHQEKHQTTIIHPDQDMVLCSSEPIIPGGELWDDEVALCRYIIRHLRWTNGWQTLYISYNGGQTTESEIRTAAADGEPVILIAGSGRATDEMAQDRSLTSLPNVHVCTLDNLSRLLQEAAVWDSAHTSGQPEGTRLVVAHRNLAVPFQVGALMSTAPAPVVVRFAGGCGKMSTRKTNQMKRFFRGGMSSSRGVLSSGGTVHPDGDFMITNLPAEVAQPGQAITIGSLPCIGTMALNRQGQLLLPGNNVGLDLRSDMIILVQDDSSVLEWDGDLKAYFQLFDEFGEYGWRIGLIVNNGGMVTKREAQMAVERGLPVILIEGSGRAADELAQGVRRHNPGPYIIVKNGDVNGLQRALLDAGLVAA